MTGSQIDILAASFTPSNLAAAQVVTLVDLPPRSCLLTAAIWIVQFADGGSTASFVVKDALSGGQIVLGQFSADPAVHLDNSETVWDSPSRWQATAGTSFSDNVVQLFYTPGANPGTVVPTARFRFVIVPSVFP